MIEIIKKGNLKKVNPKFKVKCKKCDCEFTYQQEDIKTDPRGESWVNCPTCDNVIGV